MDEDAGRDVAIVVFAGDEVLLAVGVGVCVVCCLVGTWIVEFGRGSSDDALGDGVESILVSSILDIWLYRGN